MAGLVADGINDAPNLRPAGETVKVDRCAAAWHAACLAAGALAGVNRFTAADTPGQVALHGPRPAAAIPGTGADRFTDTGGAGLDAGSWAPGQRTRWAGLVRISARAACVTRLTATWPGPHPGPPRRGPGGRGSCAPGRQHGHRTPAPEPPRQSVAMPAVPGCGFPADDPSHRG
jgi:hypothetical protein